MLSLKHDFLLQKEHLKQMLEKQKRSCEIWSNVTYYFKLTFMNVAKVFRQFSLSLNSNIGPKCCLEDPNIGITCSCQ